MSSEHANQLQRLLNKTVRDQAALIAQAYLSAQVIRKGTGSIGPVVEHIEKQIDHDPTPFVLPEQNPTALESRSGGQNPQADELKSPVLEIMIEIQKAASHALLTSNLFDELFEGLAAIRVQVYERPGNGEQTVANGKKFSSVRTFNKATLSASTQPQRQPQLDDAEATQEIIIDPKVMMIEDLATFFAQVVIHGEDVFRVVPIPE